MAKIYAEYVNNQTVVKCKLDLLEQVDYEEMEIFNNCILRGLLKPVEKSFKSIEYYVPGGISLLTYLTKGLTENDFFNIILQLSEALKKIIKYNLSSDNLYLGLDNTFINENTKEVFFVYAPVKEGKNILNIKNFISDIAYSTAFKLDEDISFIDDFLKFAGSVTELSSSLIQQYIIDKCPEAFDGLGLTIPNEIEEIESGEQEEIIIEEYPAEELKRVEISTCEIRNMIGNEDDTVTIIDTFEEQNNIHLSRVSNGQQIYISNNIFLIGKDPSKTDYAIIDNKAVSRVHVELRIIADRFFIKDLDSTNGTFINGERIEADVPEEIYDGDEIMIADETFIFYKN